jgi:hypothetical protein
MWANLIVIGVIVLIVGFALFWVIREKTKYKGNPACIGCPHNRSNSGCGRNCG